MDFLDPRKQKRNTIQLYIGYFLMTIMFSLILLILIQYVNGVGVTRQGEVIQKGLIFVSSQPSGADLFVDDELMDTTNAKLNITEGDHVLKLQRNGYHNWERAITVQGGDVDHYVYPFLFPTDLNTKELKNYETAPILVTQSPDRRWLVTLDDAVSGRFEVFDLNRSQTEIADSTEFSVPASLLSASTGTPRWEVMEWSNNNRHMLLKRVYLPSKGGAETVEYILADRQRPEGSYNLSRELGVTPSEITLRDKKPDSYYLYDASARTLSTATLGQPTPVLDLSEVLAYKTHGTDTVIYATTEKSVEGRVAIKFRQGAKDFPIRTLPESSAYTLDVARYEGNWYAVMGSHADKNVFVYRNPADTASGETVRAGAVFALRIEAPTHVSFSANAQYILAQNATSLSVYDLENTRRYSYDLPYQIDAPQAKATWMDGNRLTYVSGGKQVVFDYDNLNRHELVAASPAFPSVFDREYTYMYSFTPGSTPNSLILSTTPLRTAGDL